MNVRKVYGINKFYQLSVLVPGVAYHIFWGSYLNASCTFNNTTLNFGSYSNPKNSPSNTTSSVTVDVTCTGLLLSTGCTFSLAAGSSGIFSDRKMTQGGGFINYNIYKVDNTTIVGNGTGGSQTYSAAGGTGTITRTFLLNGIIPYSSSPNNQQASSGNYNDSMTMTFSCVNLLGLSTVSSTQPLTVTATIIKNCNVSANPLNFGLYNPLSASSTTGVISVTCTNGAAYTVGLNAGTGAGASGNTRYMTSLSNGTTLPYNLYTDSPGGNPWGTNTVAGVGNGLPQPVPVYGRIPSNQYVKAAADYRDTVTITVSY